MTHRHASCRQRAKYIGGAKSYMLDEIEQDHQQLAPYLGIAIGAIGRRKRGGCEVR